MSAAPATITIKLTAEEARELLADGTGAPDARDRLRAAVHAVDTGVRVRAGQRWRRVASGVEVEIDDVVIDNGTYGRRVSVIGRRVNAGGLGAPKHMGAHLFGFGPDYDYELVADADLSTNVQTVLVGCHRTGNAKVDHAFHLAELITDRLEGAKVIAFGFPHDLHRSDERDYTVMTLEVFWPVARIAELRATVDGFVESACASHNADHLLLIDVRQQPGPARR